MEKLKSRKFIAFTIWTAIMIIHLFTDYQLNESMINAYSKITMIYISLQGVVDGVEKYKK